MTSARVLPKRPLCVNRADMLDKLEADGRQSLPDSEGSRLTVTGPQGVGKTTMTLELAHRIKQHYDVLLYYPVQGSLPQKAVTAGQIAEFFLRRLKVPADDIPANDTERFLVLQEHLDGHCVLLVFDDVRDTAQITPLLEHVAATTVIVTSRNRMPSLKTAGFTPVHLGFFNEHSSGLLLRHFAGDQPEFDDRLVHRLHCWSGGSPLALSLAAARLCDPDFTAADIEVAFAEPPEKDPDGARAVESMFNILGDDQARQCAILALIPGPHFDAATAAAAMAVDVPAAHKILRALRNANLLLLPDDGRFGFHDMLHRFATEKAVALLTEDERHTVTGRIVEHRWRRLVALDKSISGRPEPAPARHWYASIEPAFTGPDAVREAFDELDAEWRNLVATVEEARKLARSEIGCLSPLGLWFFAFQTARHDDMIEMCDAVLAVAEDQVLRWHLLRDKAASCLGVGDDRAVDDAIQQAIALDYPPGKQSLHDWYGNAVERRGDCECALTHFALSRAAIKDMDDPIHQQRASALLDMHEGRVLAKLKRAPEATPLLSRAYEYFVPRDTERVNLARTAAWLGKITPTWETASARLLEALSVFLETGMREQAQETCEWLADGAESASRPGDAESYRQQAHELEARRSRWQRR